MSEATWSFSGARMEKLQSFQIAAREGGFVEVSQSEEGSVLWLSKSTPNMAREMHQRMCIDSLTNSVTVFWMNVTGALNSKTFREVPALQAWFAVGPELILQR